MAISNVLDTGVENLGTSQSLSSEGGTEHAGVQLDFLTTQGYDPAQIQQWREEVQAGTADVQAITDAVNEEITALGGADSATEILNGKIEENNELIQ